MEHKQFDCSPEVEQFLDSLKPKQHMPYSKDIPELVHGELEKWLKKVQLERKILLCDQIAAVINEFCNCGNGPFIRYWTGKMVEAEIRRLAREEACLEEIEATTRVTGSISYKKLRDIIDAHVIDVPQRWPLGQDEMADVSGLTDPE